MAKKKQNEQAKQPSTYEEFLEEAHKSFRQFLDADLPENPHPFYVGQPVRYGARPDVRVEEILEGGKVVHISYHDRGETYGKPYDNKRRLPMVVSWVELVPVEEETETNFRRERVRATFIHNDIGCLVHTVYHRGLMSSPEYQRGYVWTLEDKQRLIGSIFNRTDIGKFVFLSHPHPEYRLEVVDGKQRLDAILSFMQGRFEFKGKTWYQLSGMDKWAFKDHTVQYAQIDSNTVKKSDILWLFLSVNAAGVPQTEEHIAKVQKMYEEQLRIESDERTK